MRNPEDIIPCFVSDPIRVVLILEDRLPILDRTVELWEMSTSELAEYTDDLLAILDPHRDHFFDDDPLYSYNPFEEEDA